MQRNARRAAQRSRTQRDGPQGDVDGGVEVFAARTGRGMDRVTLAERHHEPGQRPGVHTGRKVTFPRRTGQPIGDGGLCGRPAGSQDLGDLGALRRARETALDGEAAGRWSPADDGSRHGTTTVTIRNAGPAAAQYVWLSLELGENVRHEGDGWSGCVEANSRIWTWSARPASASRGHPDFEGLGTLLATLTGS
ncbi:hypothetical protein AB0H83_51540 [Dactylosporangium sp. NPDC050688]|uniref:hypothetical protein n=1 Tax=Dactylosporangium sp. NPDC050688 TaxID=3157217 RepID=UPI0033FA9EF3